jgi:hypothetical protein
MSNFIEKCLRGEVLLEEIDDFVDAWHEGKSRSPLHTFLGMTQSEYSLWVVDPGVLPFIVTAHKQNCNVSDLLNKVEALPMAARSNGPEKAKKLMNWLKHEGLWK